MTQKKKPPVASSLALALIDLKICEGEFEHDPCLLPTATSHPENCKLAQLPEEILYEVFVLVGPKNNLDLTCRYFNELYKFEDTGFDEKGHWRNLNLIKSMFKTHYFIPLNKKLAFPLLLLSLFSDRLEEIEQEWTDRGRSLDSLRHARGYRHFVSSLLDAEKQIQKFRRQPYAFDFALLGSRFLCKELILLCIARQKKTIRSSLPFFDGQIIGERLLRIGDQTSRRLYTAFKFKELWVHLDHLSKCITTGDVTDGCMNLSKDEIITFQIDLPSQLEVIHSIFRDEEPPCERDVKYSRRLELYTYRCEWRDRDSALPQSLFEKSPLYFKRLSVLKLVAGWNLSFPHIEMALESLADSWAEFMIQGKDYVLGLLRELFGIIMALGISSLQFQYAKAPLLKFRDRLIYHRRVQIKDNLRLIDSSLMEHYEVDELYTLISSWFRPKVKRMKTVTVFRLSLDRIVSPEELEYNIDVYELCEQVSEESSDDSFGDHRYMTPKELFENWRLEMALTSPDGYEEMSTISLDDDDEILYAFRRFYYLSDFSDDSFPSDRHSDSDGHTD